MASNNMHHMLQAQVSLIGLLLGFRVYVPNRDKDGVANELNKLIEELRLEQVNAQDVGDMGQLISECNEVPAYACEYDRFDTLQEIDVIWVVPRHLDRIYNAFEIVCDERNKAQVVRTAFDHLRQGLLNLRIIERGAFIVCPNNEYRDYIIRKCVQDKFLIDDGNCVFKVLTTKEVKELLHYAVKFNELNRKYGLYADVESIIYFVYGI